MTPPRPQDPTPPRHTEAPGPDSSERLLAALAAAVYTCDAKGRVTAFNDAAATLWGRRPEIGTDLWCGSWKIYTPEGVPLPLDSCPMAVALREGRSIRGVEIVVERPDGTRRHVLPHPDPIRDPSGNITGAINLLVDITERKESERAQAHLAAIVDSSDDAIVSKTLDGLVTSWNAGAQRIFGYTAQEIVGRSITTLIPDVRLDEERIILARLRRGERITHYQTVRRTKDGRLIDVSLTVSPIRDAAGRLIGASKIARDITAQKHAERALERSERALADFFENATIGLHWVDPHGIVLRANRAELAMLGYEPHEYIGRHLSEFHADRAVLDDILDRLARGEDLAEHPARMRRKDGAIRHVRISSSVLREDGRFVHTRCFTRDVTDQVEAQEALAQSESQLRTLLSVLPVGVYSCDADGRITFYNRRAAEQWGRDPDLDTARFCGCARMFWPDGTPIPWDQIPMAVALREGVSFRNTEAIVERPDGSRFHASVTIDPDRDADGRIRGAINVFQDVTIQVAAREALEHQQRLLEEAVVRRTAELEESHRQLRLSERMAVMGTLSVGLGHDLGNLLLPVRASLDSLASASLGDDLKDELQRIRTSIQYLQQLANGLRMMAAEPTSTEPAPPLQVSAWWAEAQTVIRNALPRTIPLHTEVQSDVWVRISRPALTQIVFNLAQNAADALRDRPDAAVRLTAHLEGEHAVLCVQDNGPGMTAEVKSRCMEPFFTTKPRGISTGFGLVLIGGLVRTAGGAVEIESEPGRGATFRLCFPRAAPEAPPVPGAAPGRYALVDVQDPRRRAAVNFELARSGLQVLGTAPGAGLDIAVTDRPPPLPAEVLAAREVILLGELSEHPANVNALGPHPAPEALRSAIRSAVRSSPPAPSVFR